MPDIVCATCGKVFDAKPSQIAAGKRFCSRACRFPHTSIICDTCGKTVRVHPSEAANGKRFCSWECRIARPTITCRQCGKQFTVPPSHAETQFCSKACYDDSQRNTPTVICAYCGRAFGKKPSQIVRSKQNFCSRECSWLGHRARMTVTCEWCGKSLERIRGWQNSRHFCSKRCSGYGTQAIGPENRAWKGGRRATQRERSHAWAKMVKEAAGRVCQCCGSAKHLHAHHILPHAEYPEKRFDPANGVCLCRVCHEAAHGWRKPQMRLSLEVSA